VDGSGVGTAAEEFGGSMMNALCVVAIKSHVVDRPNCASTSVWFAPKEKIVRRKCGGAGRKSRPAIGERAIQDGFAVTVDLEALHEKVVRDGFAWRMQLTDQAGVRDRSLYIVSSGYRCE